METKKLYILTSDAGDGSRGVRYSMSREWIDKQQERYDSNELDYDDGGVDGNGFSYRTLNVPEEMTAKDLGIFYLLEDEED